MRNHDECEPAIRQAQAEHKHAFAMYLAARCDLHHGPQVEDDPDPQRLREAAEGASK